MKSIVLFSLKHVNSINLFPFKLAKRNLSEPTEFEVTIVVNDVGYQYGFQRQQQKLLKSGFLLFLMVMSKNGLRDHGIKKIVIMNGVLVPLFPERNNLG